MKELNQSILNNFINSLKILFKEKSKYEFKLEILQLILPFMKSENASDFVLIFENVLKQPS